MPISFVPRLKYYPTHIMQATERYLKENPEQKQRWMTIDTGHGTWMVHEKDVEEWREKNPNLK